MCPRSVRSRRACSTDVRRLPQYAARDEREIYLDDVELDFAQQAKAGVPRADIVGCDSHSGSAARLEVDAKPPPAGIDAGPAEVATGSLSPARPAAATDVRSDVIPSDEAQLPRWLRPSVQAARHDQRGSRSDTRRLEDS